MKFLVSVLVVLALFNSIQTIAQIKRITPSSHISHQAEVAVQAGSDWEVLRLTPDIIKLVTTTIDGLPDEQRNKAAFKANSPLTIWVASREVDGAKEFLIIVRNQRPGDIFSGGWIRQEAENQSAPDVFLFVQALSFDLVKSALLKGAA